MYEFILAPRSICGRNQISDIGLPISYSSEQYLLLSEGERIEIINDTAIYISGYVLPRNAMYRTFGMSGQHELIRTLFSDYGLDFINYIKGIFLIIVFEKKAINIFTDHLGLFNIFYTISEGHIFVTNSINYLKRAGIELLFDEASLSMQSLFHRVPLKYTIYRNLFNAIYGTRIAIQNEGVFVTSYWNPEMLLNKEEDDHVIDFNEIAGLFKENIRNFNNFLNPGSNYITLTGGKDSRTILAALMNLGIKPDGLTYGSPKSRDAIFAALLAETTGINLSIVNPEISSGWFEKKSKEISSFGNPGINIHRSHRLFAFSQIAGKSGTDCAFYTGYLGGELMMGIYNDDLIFTDFLTKFWASGKLSGVEQKLADYFHKKANINSLEVKRRIEELKCMREEYSESLQSFYGLFEIGIPHHSQDIFLANKFWNYPYPAFLDIEFLELLFKSEYSFLYHDDKSVSPLKRHKLYELNMNIQHILFQKLDKVKFGKKGTYNITEYLKGPFYWSIIKTIRYLTEKSDYPTSFSYGTEYREFLIGCLRKIQTDKSSSLNEFFLADDALENLLKSDPLTSERVLHKYSNIVMFYYQEKALTNES